MPDVDLNFSRDEYARRIAKVRRAMERQGIEMLIVTVALPAIVLFWGI